MCQAYSFPHEEVTVDLKVHEPGHLRREEWLTLSEGR
jgi:hypothetical protein